MLKNLELNGLTMDGSKVGELEYENFNAAGAKITFKGKVCILVMPKEDD
jgi:di/tripeptidase